jgi:hypothetical protein
LAPLPIQNSTSSNVKGCEMQMHGHEKAQKVTKRKLRAEWFLTPRREGAKEFPSDGDSVRTSILPGFLCAFAPMREIIARTAIV